MWKAILKSFEVIGEGLAWKVGNGRNVCIGKYPWPGNGLDHLLPPNIIDYLSFRGLIHLNHIVKPTYTSIWK